MQLSIAWAADSVKKTFSDEDVYFRRNSSKASLGMRIYLPMRTLRICSLRISS